MFDNLRKILENLFELFAANDKEVALAVNYGCAVSAELFVLLFEEFYVSDVRAFDVHVEGDVERDFAFAFVHVIDQLDPALVDEEDFFRLVSL